MKNELDVSGVRLPHTIALLGKSEANVNVGILDSYRATHGAILAAGFTSFADVRFRSVVDGACIRACNIS